MLSVSQRRQKLSENIGLVSVAAFESSGGAFVQNSLRFQALVLIVVVGLHASSELPKISFAELGKDGLSWRSLILSWEAKGC